VVALEEEAVPLAQSVTAEVPPEEEVAFLSPVVVEVVILLVAQ
jgi:hypothetical protein